MRAAIISSPRKDFSTHVKEELLALPGQSAPTMSAETGVQNDAHYQPGQPVGTERRCWICMDDLAMARSEAELPGHP
jgi:hypothetical protein